MAETIRRFFAKATVFFSAVNKAQTKNTGCLSSMLESNTLITKFANETEDNLRLLAGNPYLKQITSMCSRKGVPDPVKAAQITGWDCWKVDGTFSVELLRAFSSMMSGRGLISDQARVVEMRAWECWQLGGEFSMELLRTVSSIQEPPGTVPEIVRTTVTARIGQIDDMSNMPIVEIQSCSSASPFVPTSPAAASAIQPAHATVEIAIQELERFHVLESVELEMLEPWRDLMAYTQLKSVIDKMNLDTVDLETGLAWRIAFESRARDHFDSSLDDLLEPSLEGADD